MAIVSGKLVYSLGHRHAAEFMICLEGSEVADTAAFGAGAIMGIARYLQKTGGATFAAGILYAAADTVAADVPPNWPRPPRADR